MKIKNIVLSILIILSLSCTNETDESNTSNLWIDSERVSCTGVGEQTCYKIQESDAINNTNWVLFYDAIEGFDNQYETGYIYKISVTKNTVKNPPADASSIRYKLNKILSKELVE